MAAASSPAGAWRPLGDDGGLWSRREAAPDDDAAAPPPPLSRVSVHVRAWHPPEGCALPGAPAPEEPAAAPSVVECFLAAEREELDFVLGRGEVPLALELAVCEMRPGERARVDAEARFGYSSAARAEEAGAEPGRAVCLDVRLLRWEEEKSPLKMRVEEALAYAESRRDTGRALWKAGRPASALRQYERAVLCLEQRLGQGVRGTAAGGAAPPMPAAAPEAGGDATAEEVRRARALVGLHLGNAAACHFRAGRLEEAERACTQSLAAAPANPRTLRRRAEARAAMRDHAGAAEDLALAADHARAAGDNDAADAAEAALARARKASSRADRAAARKLRGAFGGGEELYGDKPAPRGAPGFFGAAALGARALASWLCPRCRRAEKRD